MPIPAIAAVIVANNARQIQSRAGTTSPPEPVPLSGPEVLIAKTFIVLCFAGAIFGAWRNRWADWEDIIACAVLGALTLPFLGLCIVGAGLGIQFLLS